MHYGVIPDEHQPYATVQSGSLAIATSTLDSLLDLMAAGILRFTHSLLFCACSCFGWGSKLGSGGVASAKNEAIDRRERLRRLALETIDLAKDPYFMCNHLGSYECKLFLTWHNNEGNYLAHTHGKRHQTNLVNRAVREAKDAPAQPQPHKRKVNLQKTDEDEAKKAGFGVSFSHGSWLLASLFLASCLIVLGFLPHWTTIVVTADGGATLAVDTQDLRLNLRMVPSTSSSKNFPFNQGILKARVGRNADGIDLNLYHQSLKLKRHFQSDQISMFLYVIQIWMDVDVVLIASNRVMQNKLKIARKVDFDKETNFRVNFMLLETRLLQSTLPNDFSPSTKLAWCWIYRKILELCPIIQRFVFSRIGDDTRTFAWSDNWIECGSLMNLISFRCFSHLGFTRMSVVQDVLNACGNSWPMTLIKRCPELTACPVPNLDLNSRDLIFWRRLDGSMGDLTVKDAYVDLVGAQQRLRWTKAVLFKGCIPKHAFCMWLVYHGRLPTQDASIGSMIRPI
ncbi:hypothetical protein OSB04_017637 [Centaurea solstitialis]|uniref:Reverse transcriptase zinc-binding domain-containing protein n=1 Tax=Centaurea solstitialis TaxID=347529 RepID=A0AA38WAV2_9ASTR|nr:hypothetical protein OSB04_017637 [Centaurea solstitialis]